MAPSSTKGLLVYLLAFLLILKETSEFLQFKGFGDVSIQSMKIADDAFDAFDNETTTPSSRLVGERGEREEQRHGGGDHNTNTNTSTTTVVHVLFALSGNNPGFLSEFEVAMKSLLLNAPLDYPLHIHVLADGLAYDGLDDVFNRTEISTWKTRNPITINTYNAQKYVEDWTKRVETFLNVNDPQNVGYHSGKGSAFSHTIGTWFRLFAYEVLPNHIQNVIYMDTDVVIMSNIEALWKRISPEPLFYMGRLQCAGFIVMNLQKTQLVWEKAATLDLYNISRHIEQQVNDQLILRAVNYSYPELVGVLPNEWDINIADGVWRFQKNIVEQRPKIGMMHFNGGGSSKDAYFLTHDFLDDTKSFNEGTFRLAKYYADLPWTWARYTASTHIRGGDHSNGYPLLVHHKRLATAAQ